MSRKSSLSSLGWAASVVTIILGLLLLVSPSSVFRLHTVGNSALMRASILALPWAWLGAIYAIPLVWLLLVGWILGLFVAIGMFSKKRTPRRTEAERTYEHYPHRKGPTNHRTNRKRDLRGSIQRQRQDMDRPRRRLGCYRQRATISVRHHSGGWNWNGPEGSIDRDRLEKPGSRRLVRTRPSLHWRQ